MSVQDNSLEKRIQGRIEKIKHGGDVKYHESNEKKGKLFVRDRLKLLFDPGFELEDALFANCINPNTPG